MMHSILHPTYDYSIPIHTRISPRAKRIILRADAHKQMIELVYPKRVSKKKAEAFLAKQHAWITQQVATWEPIKQFEEGAVIPILGEEYHIARLSDGLRGTPVYHDETTQSLYVRGEPEHIPRRVKDYLKKRAREQLSDYVQHYAKILDVKYRRIILRDTVSRWGSCSSEGVLSFSWRLIMLPQEVLAYVAAHEVAHLREMNHSTAFWQQVAILQPEYKTHRAWLKVHGGQVHGWE